MKKARLAIPALALALGGTIVASTGASASEVKPVNALATAAAQPSHDHTNEEASSPRLFGAVVAVARGFTAAKAPQAAARVAQQAGFLASVTPSDADKAVEAVYFDR